jgi:hypothetical protein
MQLLFEGYIRNRGFGAKTLKPLSCEADRHIMAAWTYSRSEAGGTTNLSIYSSNLFRFLARYAA